HDYVTALHARSLRRAARTHRADDRAGDLLQPEALREIRGDRLHRHAELRAVDAAALPQLVHDVPRHVRGNREADADVAVRVRQDLRVDSDELALRVHERAAGVAVIDRGVGLEEVLITTVASPGRTALRADDAHRDGLANPERVADRQHDIAHL